MVEFVIAHNPDAVSKLPYLISVPLGDGLVFRARETWPRTKAVYCHPVDPGEMVGAEIVETVAVRSCVRRGRAIDLVLDRGRENRSQLVYTKARGPQVVFWQTPRVARQSRPNVRPPTGHAAGLPDLEIIVDSHERYAWRFPGRQVHLVHRALSCGDYGTTVAGRVVGVVERKSVADLLSSLTSGKLGYALGELAAMPRAAVVVVVEDRYAAVFKHDHIRPVTAADGLAELQVRWPNVPMVFCDTRDLAQEWTYRFLAAAARYAAADAGGRRTHLRPVGTHCGRAGTVGRRTTRLGPPGRPTGTGPGTDPCHRTNRLASNPQPAGLTQERPRRSGGPHPTGRRRPCSPGPSMTSPRSSRLRGTTPRPRSRGRSRRFTPATTTPLSSSTPPLFEVVDNLGAGQGRICCR
jgi:hypothetical protein